MTGASLDLKQHAAIGFAVLVVGLGLALGLHQPAAYGIVALAAFGVTDRVLARWHTGSWLGSVDDVEGVDRA